MQEWFDIFDNSYLPHPKGNKACIIQTEREVICEHGDEAEDEEKSLHLACRDGTKSGAFPAKVSAARWEVLVGGHGKGGQPHGGRPKNVRQTHAKHDTMVD
jgi:hypothetical protein